MQMQTNSGVGLCMCAYATRRDFKMMHNACIPVCALIHLLSCLPGLPYTGLVRIIKSGSFLFYFMQVFLACSDLFTCTTVSQRYWFSVSLKTCISFHNNVYRISTALRGFQLMWLWSGIWTQIRVPSSLNLPYSYGGVRGQMPSPLVTCLLLCYTAAQILQPPHRGS